tara:strand:+ start:2680 stop:3948 length:1269 start_codon:yes stop_codon:yes gene_type:complete
MNHDILISADMEEFRAARIEDGCLTELKVYSRVDPSPIGKIYLGRIIHIATNINAAFVNIGKDQNGFLSFGRTATRSNSKCDGELETSATSSVLHEGQVIMTQVVADPISTKSAILTTNISLPGQFVVYVPAETGVVLSRQITDDVQRCRIQKVVEGLYKSLRVPQGRLIIRTAATRAGTRDLSNDIQTLLAEWQLILNATSHTAPPTCIWGEIDPLNQLLRDVCAGNTRRILFDSKEYYRRAVQYCQKKLPHFTDCVELFGGPGSLFSQYKIEEKMQGALMREQKLPSGAVITIDETEAFTAIDVDTRSFAQTTNPSVTTTRVNREAAQEIARQLRLRNIGGLIIVDFLDPKTENDRLQLLETVRIAVSHDIIHTRVSHVSPSGITEIRRQRQRASLRTYLTEPCCHCDATGRTLDIGRLS